MAAQHPLRAAAYKKAQAILTVLSQATDLDSLAAHKHEIETLLKIADLSFLLKDIDFEDAQPKEEILAQDEKIPQDINLPPDDSPEAVVSHSAELSSENFTIHPSPVNEMLDGTSFDTENLSAAVAEDKSSAPIIQHYEKTEELENETQPTGVDMGLEKNNEQQTPTISDASEVKTEAEIQAQKLRLAKIKALKHEEVTPKSDASAFSSSSVAGPDLENASLQNEPFYLDFKLDLNDRIAFTQKLFDGSQSDLNQAVQTLNSFRTVEQAQRYLSDLYYERNWQHAEEYAQRLWSLVENKFL